MHSYGFIKSPDDTRDIIFDVTSAVPSEYKLSNVPGVIDQGSEPICAAISLSTIINWQEKAKTGKEAVDRYSIYNLREDKSMNGMIPREALKALKKKGACGYKLESYSRIYNADSAKAAIQVNGPIMVCFEAYDCAQFWKPEGAKMGGHAVVLTGWDEDGFVLQNSWGTAWGSGGKMTLPYDDWKYVIESWTIMI